jgi:hypothetical protein
MKRPSVALLAVAAGLFAVWIGYLAYLALTASHPIVLSRPQFLMADLWVVADVEGPEGPVAVSEVVYAAPPVRATAPKVGAVIQVDNLADCKRYWTGRGKYILPLAADDKGYRVPAVPRSPGYPPSSQHGPECLIYPDTPETHGQLSAMRDLMTRP